MSEMKSDKAADTSSASKRPWLSSYNKVQPMRSRTLGIAILPEAVDRDIEKLESIGFNRDYSEYSVGEWASLALFNRDGDAESSKSHEYVGIGCWTTNADMLPAIKELASKFFKADYMLSARIFSCRNGGFIRPHRDYIEFKNGFTRVHLVLRTNKKAMNGEGGRAYHMAAGSLWFLDGRELHWAANLAKEARYHLVCDFPASMSPEECVEEGLLKSNEVEWCERPPLAKSTERLLQLAAKSVSTADLPDLLDVADSLYVNHQCDLGTPYDLVLPHLGDRKECIKQVVDRRTYFLGF